MPFIIACTLIALASIWIMKQRYRAARQLLIPPGPPGHWLLRNRMPKLHGQNNMGPCYHSGKLAVGFRGYRTSDTEYEELILDMLNDPKNHEGHAMRYAASVVMSFTYGKTTPTSYTDPGPEIVGINQSLARFGKSMRRGAYQRARIHCRNDSASAITIMSSLTIVKSEGTADPPSQVCICDHNHDYGCYPSHGRTGSCIKELDDLVGRMRLPTFEDQEMLPQVTAFILESMRWRPVSFGFAHRATKDIVWKNYLIPAGLSQTILRSSQNRTSSILSVGLTMQVVYAMVSGFSLLALAAECVLVNTSQIALILWAFRLSENPAAKIDSLDFSDTAAVHAAPFDICFEKRIDENLIRELCAPGE
ncbi:hypothetical protein BDR04DRAFT_1141430 [Suillus decipiens]|nr:hypothetical protein BDR04DRAFT_1141430 [Suillus decipiens]